LSEAPASSGSCAFCEIVSGRVSSHVVFEDEHSLAFLDSRPLFPGHSLLVPREHHETLLDLPDDLITTLFTNARLLARAMEDGLEAEGSFVALNNRVSQSVPHVHVHVVPRRRKDGLRGFFWPRQKYTDEAHAEETARLLRSTVDALRP
jgi:histidine triad (HIT) family protein